MSRPALSSTTLSAAITATQTKFVVGSTSGINGLGSLASPQSLLVVGAEAMLVLNVPVSGTVEVHRGANGTRPRSHASGATAYFGSKDTFDFSRPGPDGNLVGLVGNSGTLPFYRLPVNHRAVDPNTGFEYVLCDAAEAIDAGKWVVINASGSASLLSTTGKGRVGIAVEAAGTSDVLIWVLVVGTYAAALFDTDVTTACVLIAGAGLADISTTSGGNVIHGASCIVTPTCAGVGTAYLNNPWCYGIENAITVTL